MFTRVTALFLLALLALSSAQSVKVIHAVAGGPNVDVYVNGALALSNVAYKAQSDYLAVSGSIEVVITATGSTDPLISTGTLDLDDNRYTVVAVGELSDLDNFPLTVEINEDLTEGPSDGNTAARFVHTSAGSPNVDVYIGGDLAFSDIEYREATNYAVVPTGTYEVYVNVADTTTTVVGPVSLTFSNQQAYSIYAVGIAGDATNGLDAVVTVDAFAGEASPASPVSPVSPFSPVSPNSPNSPNSPSSPSSPNSPNSPNSPSSPNSPNDILDDDDLFGSSPASTVVASLVSFAIVAAMF